MLKKYKKIILISAGGLLAFLVVVILVLRMALPSIIKSQIESIGTQTLGVAVTVGDVDLGLLQGKAVIQGLTIANPEGFEGTLLELGGGGANVSLLSLMSNTIIIDSIDVEGTRLNFSGTSAGRSNVQSLLDGMPTDDEEEDDSGDDTPSDSKDKESSSKSIIIKQVAVSDTIVTMKDLDTNKVVTTRLGNLTIKDAGYPAAGQKLPKSIMTIETSDFEFSLKTPENVFEEPTIASYRESMIGLELNQLIATLENPQIIFSEFSIIDFIAYSEVLDPNDKENEGADNHRQATETAMASMGQSPEEEETATEEEPKKSILRSATALLTGSEEEVVAEQEATDEPPFDFIKFSLFRFTAKELTMIEHGDEPSRMSLYNIIFDASDIRYPQSDNDAIARASLNPIELDSSLNLDAKGQLLHTDKVGDFTAIMISNNQSLAGIGPFKSGRARLEIDLEVKDQVGKGTLTFKSNKFELNQDGSTLNRIAMAPVQALGKVEGPEVTVPLSFKLEESSWSDFGKKFGDALLKSVLDALQQSAKQIAGNLKDAVDTEKLKDAAENLGDSIKSGVEDSEIDDKLKEAGNKVGDEAKKVGEKLKGLF